VRALLLTRGFFMSDVLYLQTPGLIARRMGVPLHRILHILATRPDIQPTARAGTLRVYDGEAIARIRIELKLQNARHQQHERRAGNE